MDLIFATGNKNKLLEINKKSLFFCISITFSNLLKPVMQIKNTLINLDMHTNLKTGCNRIFKEY